jgi:hypothetical protein
VGKLGELFYRLIKGKAAEGNPMHCASCGRKVTDPEACIVLEVELGEYLVTCCELCSAREWRKRAVA